MKKNDPQKLNIAFIIDQFDIGGTENQLADLIRHLDRSKFRVDLVCLRPTAYFKSISLPCNRKVLNIRSLASFDTVKKMAAFVRWLKRREIRIVHAFFFDATIFAALAARLAGGITVVAGKRDLGFWHTPKLRWMLRLMRPLIDAYVANSFAVKKTLIEKEKVNSHKIHVIYNGINLPGETTEHQKQTIRGEFNLRNDDRIIGIVANLNRPVKRVDLFLRAAYLVLEHRKNLKFIIVGDGHLKGRLQSMAYQLGIDSQIVFAGRKANPQPYIGIFDVGVLASDTEGFSNSILEYLANGVPVVASRAGGNLEILKDTSYGRLFEPGNPDSLADQILYLLENNTVNEMAQKEIRSKAAGFLWPEVIDNHEGFYRDLA